MKLLRYTISSAQVAFLMLALNACAGGDGASTEEPLEAGNEANVADANETGLNGENGNNANAENGNEDLGNNANGNNLSNNGNPGNNAPESANEFVNNAAGENFLSAEGGNPAATAPATDATAAENSAEDLGIPASGDTLGGNQAAVNEAAVAKPDANMGATDASLAPATAGAVAPAPISGGRVHYVVKGGTTAHDKPSGQVVKNLEQGDHPLVSIEGEWAHTSDGVYISNSALTQKPVPRAKSPKPWR